MRRQSINSSSHSARMGSMSRATIRKVDHSTVIPSADMDAGANDSPKGVPIVQPYGFSYWPKSQEEDKGGQKQQSTGGEGGQSGGGGLGGTDGTGPMDKQQPKGKSAIGLTSYANGNRSDPSSQNLQDPRHHMMLEDPKEDKQQGGGQSGGAGGSSGGSGGGKKEYGGKEGDVALYRTSDPDNIQQFHLTEEGPRLSSVKKWQNAACPGRGRAVRGLAGRF